MLALRQQGNAHARTGRSRSESAPSDPPGVVAYPGIGDWVSAASSSLHEDVGVAPLRRLLFIGNLIPLSGLTLSCAPLQNAPRTLSLDVVGSERVDPGYASAMRTLAADLQVSWHACSSTASWQMPS